MSVEALVAHSVPGRLRVRVEAPSTAQRNDVLDAISTVTTKPGIDQVRTDRRTGSALVTYEPDRLTVDEVVDLLRDAHEVLRVLAPPAVTAAVDGGISDTAALIRGGMHRADGSVMRATRGVVDLRVLVPISLAGLSARQLVRNGVGFRAMPWYVLAYYAFDTFVKLYPGSPDSIPPMPAGIEVSHS